MQKLIKQRNTLPMNHRDAQARGKRQVSKQTNKKYNEVLKAP